MLRRLFTDVREKWGESLALAAIYFWMGRLGVLTAIPPGVASVIWPASGIALAVLLLRGQGVWPGIFVGSFLLNFPILESLPDGSLWLAPFVAAFLIAFGSAVQALIACALIRRFISAGHFLDRAPNVVRLMLIAAASCAVSASLGTLSLCVSGSCDSGGNSWLTWWLGDLVGIYVIAPFVLVLQNPKLAPGRRLTLPKLCFHCALFGGGSALFRSSFRLARSPGRGLCFLSDRDLGDLPFWSRGRSFGALDDGGARGLGNRQRKHSIRRRKPAPIPSLRSAIRRLSCHDGAPGGRRADDRRRSRVELTRLLEVELTLQRELARSNRDLERFAQLASHDLREPVRTVLLHLDLLKEAGSGTLDTKSEKFLAFAINGAQRMNLLIQNILEYSKVDSKVKEFEMVPCERVLNEALSNLKATIEEKKVNVRIDPLPTIVGDPVQLGQLQNLISNGVKYREESVQPEIRVTAQRNGGEWLFRVVDNGIGFDMKYREKIFDIFRRLHSADRFTGSGLGLAMCKSIVERHGGKIWAESEVGRGSTFYFTLPAPNFRRSEPARKRLPHRVFS